VEDLLSLARRKLGKPVTTPEERKNKLVSILVNGTVDAGPQAAFNSLKDISKALNCVIAPPKERMPLFSMTSSDAKKQRLLGKQLYPNLISAAAAAVANRSVAGARARQTCSKFFNTK
jgi:hypothetical protein